MSGLWVFACLAGLKDGLNPCVFVSVGVFILLGTWLQKRPVKAGHWQAVFGLVYALGFFEFNFGPGESLILQKGFISIARMIYFGLGMAAFILGLVFFRWWHLSRGHEDPEAAGENKNTPAQNWQACLTAGLAALFFSMLAAIMPISSYMALISYGVILKGGWAVGLPVLTGYIFCSLWPLWLLWAFMAAKNLQRSLVNIVYSSVFFTASSSMLLILSKR